MINGKTIIGMLYKAVERVTESFAIIDTDHKYIHEGILFETYFQVNLTAATGVSYISLTTPADKYIHYRPSYIVSSVDKLTVEFFEGSTVTAGTGSDLTNVNHNRNSAVTSKVTAKSGVTVTADGTKLTSTYIPGSTGTGGTRVGSAFGPAANEWVLKPSTTYTIKLSNTSSAANLVQINLFWYEEDNA